MALHSVLCATLGLDAIHGVVSMRTWLPAAFPRKSNYSTCAPGKQFAAALN